MLATRVTVKLTYSDRKICAVLSLYTVGEAKSGTSDVLEMSSCSMALMFVYRKPVVSARLAASSLCHHHQTDHGAQSMQGMAL